MPQDFRIKNRIQTINTIGKISRALQLVSTAKLKKASKRIQEIRPYSEEMYDVFHHIISNTNDSIYLQKDAGSHFRTVWIIINSNIGLCAGYNYNIHKLVIPEIKKSDLLIVIGAKGISYYQNRDYNVISSYSNLDLNFEYHQAQEIGFQVLSMFNNKEIERIKLVYTKFINSILFQPTVLQLLPIAKINTQQNSLFEFEPDAQTVLETTILLYLNTIIYSAISESQVSEQASRRLAMENATNNANELKDNLTLQYNRSRQAKITQEIAEIIAAADSTN
ncbi:ATP synthase F1 subunit gamma [Spiroplasma endosymbiont of Nephrotoma flavescens]|uniref:ATP synthase F1 subunit gamma n=1 Tax=Spiroplasma endosymbiont of Nephrotoma flavescens TaxID=3066302 RepID=UPI00313CC7B1